MRPTVRLDRRLILAGALAVVVLLCLLVPWIRSNPPSGLTGSNSPYTDEGFYNDAARSFVLFGSFGKLGLFPQLTNTGYTLAEAALFSVTGPQILAARALSVFSVCMIVLLALWGLRGPLGLPAAAVVAAGIGGNQLVLLYGHIGIIEPFETMLLFGSFLAMFHAVIRQRASLGALSGILLALAIGAKASAALVVPAVIGVPLLIALFRRSWSRLKPPLAAVGTLSAAIGLWFVVVAMPNHSELSSGLKALPGIHLASYPPTVQAAFRKLWHWLATPRITDFAWHRLTPVFLAAVLGTACLLLLRRRSSPAHVYVTVTGWVWAVVTWAIPVLGVYAPNRYFVVTVPGLALAAGPGLGLAVEWLAGKFTWPIWRMVGVLVLVCGVALPGVLSYLSMERTVSDTNQLQQDQMAVDRALPRNAVLFGIYAPEVAFSSRIHDVTPWPATGLHMQDPMQSYGVNYVVADVSSHASSADLQVLRAVRSSGFSLGRPLLILPWGPHRLEVFPVLRAPSSPTRPRGPLQPSR